MSQNDVALSDRDRVHFEIGSSIVDAASNLIYLVPLDSCSIVVYRIVDTSPSLVVTKEFRSVDQDWPRFVRLLVSPSKSSLIVLSSDRSLLLFGNERDQLTLLSQVR